MVDLYVANCNRLQSFELLYRLPEAPTSQPPTSRMIRPMTVFQISNLNDPEAQAIEDQLTRYGARDISERLTGGAKIERLFSRSPINAERVRKALAFNVNLMNAESKERLRLLGAAMSKRAEQALIELDPGVANNFNAIETSVQENSESPTLAYGTRVETTDDDRSRTASRGRNRRRRA